MRLNCNTCQGPNAERQEFETYLLCYDVSEEITAIAATSQPRRGFIGWVGPKEIYICFE